MEALLSEFSLEIISSEKRRTTYCFRHTYATFRLTEGVDVYFLSKQMGTSVKMIEDHYGHVSPVKNAERILPGLRGWEPVVVVDQVRAESDEGALGAREKGKRNRSRDRADAAKKSAAHAGGAPERVYGQTLPDSLAGMSFIVHDDSRLSVVAQQHR